MSPATTDGQLDTLALWCGALVAVTSAAGLLWRITRALHHLVRRVEDAVTDWAGTEEHPGVMTRLDRIEHRIGAIEYQLHPNSGTSLRDAVDRVDQRTARHLDPP
ncbi:hypothetical protein CFP65_3306 [Kitasatospora sp. MMS16-BH015]|uniref:hypothetical protein n=1 Tax=Kitasatospora sp. MMS16-BH015 TaxID=2018025 RepID=UPI000CA1C717|nr:hypothetical protein [Kitasatospora sp. MMS16-BH015]AUG78106.1 hypothetical protein CFP65_3306 [Kitasatospora sp. MMS16-BH015]